MEIQFSQGVPNPGDIFARDAFDSNIGKMVPVHLGGDGSGESMCRIVAAEVSEDQLSVMFTLAIPDSDLPDDPFEIVGGGMNCVVTKKEPRP